MGVLSRGGLVSTNFQRPYSGETMPCTPKRLRYKNVLEVLYHCAKFDGARISPAAGAAKDGQRSRSQGKVMYLA